MKKILAILLSAVLLFSVLTACGASNAPAEEYQYALEAPGAPAEGLYESGVETSGTVLPTNRKLIKTVYLDAETQDLDSLMTHLDQQVASLGGYMEGRSVYNGSAGSTYRRAELTIRIPASEVDAFVEKIADYSNIISSKQTVEDVTLDYVDTESRVTALETEQARLLELLENAETMADLLEIESRLTEVRYELERYASQLRVYDNLIDFATIHLEISQVRELTEEEPETFWERISTGFMNSLKDLWNFLVELVITLIVGLPYIVVLGAVAAAVLSLLRLRRKKRANKAKKMTSEPPKE